MFRRTLASLALIGMVFASGCAEEQDLVDRTETNALPKSLFTGEWFYNQTVVDAPNHNLPAWIPVGSTNYSGAKRVRWEIQEGWLYARKSYEHIIGSTRETAYADSTNGTGDDAIDEMTGEYKGTIVGAWRIESHFDVKRQYNPTTGQELNVLTENSSDCKWYACKYMRVDWSENKAVDYLFLDYDEDINKQPMPFYFETEDDPRFTPIFDEEKGYIDVTHAMVLDPGTVNFRWGGQTYTYPLCWLTEAAECSPIIVKIRNSFMKREPNRDYQPRQHVGEITEWFGFFTNDRLIWDNRFGMSEKIRQRVINRHNIWTNWHSAQACTTDDECGAGSKCDKMLAFYKAGLENIDIDSDVDGMPDLFEEKTPHNPKSADSDGDKVIDRNEDRVGLKYTYAEDGSVTNVEIVKEADGLPDIQNFWKWAQHQKEYRCTVPEQDRIPRPIAYFNTGYFPRDLVCDDDKAEGPCDAWQWDADVNVRTKNDSKWSVVHQVSNNYDEAFWRIFLRGNYGWSQADLDKWVATHDPTQFSAEQQEVLGRFGDINDPTGPNGLYAAVICPNNPPQDSDPWPCRFNKKSWEQAKKLIEEGKDKIENRPLVRRGDIRFSQINYVAGYSEGLLGLGPSHTDPITGENFAGVANVYHLNDVAANSVREMVGLLNGTISTKDYVDGVDLEKWVGMLNLETIPGQKAHKFTHKDLVNSYRSTVQPWMKRIQRVGNGSEIMDAHKTLSSNQVKAMAMSHMNKTGLFDPAKASVPGLSLIKGTNLEKRLIDPETLDGSGYAPGTVGEITDEVLNKSSLARGGWIKMAEARSEWRNQMAQRLNMFFKEMADDAMIGLATRLKNKSDEEVYKTARRVIMRAVLTHEMGHTFGLHHNWTGSEDSMNFFPDYWRLRTNDYKDTKYCTGPWSRHTDTSDSSTFGTANPQAEPTDGDGKLCPFFIKPMNDYQKGLDAKSVTDGLNPMHEYSYSSIMDYAGRYTIDGHGLGKYDIAAMLYGHADKIEVFEKYPDSIIKGGPNWLMEWRESDGAPLLLYSPPISFHYTQYWQWFADGTGDAKNLVNDSNRMVVPWDQVKKVKDQNGRDAGVFYQNGNKLYPRVPYLFCTWTAGDISEGCNTRDYGVDPYEKMKRLTDEWDSYYPLRAFTRYKFGMSKWGYIGRYYRRMYYKLKDFNNIYALYQGMFRQWFDENQIEGFYTDALEGWGSYTVALNKGFDMALQTMAMPDIKNFARITTPDDQMIAGEGVYTAEFTPDLVNARYFTTSYMTGDYERTCGLIWWECLHHIGFYTDKVMSLLAISDPRTYFVGQDTSEDVREYRVSFFDNYSEQLIDFFGSVLSNEYDDYSPYFDPDLKSTARSVDANGNEWRYGIAWRRYADKTKDVTKGANAVAIEPATRFTFKMYMMVLGFLRFENNFDKSFTNRSLMWKQGSGQGWDIVPTEMVDGTVTFTDPFNGHIYVGADYKDGRGIAQRMIAYANKLKARTQYCNTSSGQADSCVEANDKAEGALWDYIQLMEVMVELTGRYSGWGGWNWNPFNP